jgi:hypothetical protein
VGHNQKGRETAFLARSGGPAVAFQGDGLVRHLSICTAFPVHVGRAGFPNQVYPDRGVVVRHKDDAQIGFSPFHPLDPGLRRATCRSAGPFARMFNSR